MRGDIGADFLAGVAGVFLDHFERDGDAVEGLGGPAIGWSASADRPGASVSRWPARLPLSTDETYIGCSGARLMVSYQL